MLKCLGDDKLFSLSKNNLLQRCKGMTFETWIAYLFASLIISIIPGPSVFTVLAQSISYGAK